MSVALVDALTKLLHELAPWAAVVISAIAAWQSKRAKDYGKNNGVDLQKAKQAAHEAKVEAANAHAVGKATSEKVDSLTVAVNGRVEQLVDAAKREGYAQGSGDVQQQQRIGE